jgi:AraC-like DNA-binding protein
VDAALGAAALPVQTVDHAREFHAGGSPGRDARSTTVRGSVTGVNRHVSKRQPAVAISRCPARFRLASSSPSPRRVLRVHGPDRAVAAVPPADHAVRLLTLVPPEASAHLSRALQPGITFTAARDVPEFFDALERGAPDVLVIDPRLVPPRSMQPFIQAVRNAAAPVLAHTALTSLGMRALLSLSQAGIREVLIRGVDDDAPSLRRAIDRLRQETLGGRVLGGLASALRIMPEPLRAAVTARFVHPDASDTPHRLAAQAGINRRSLDRWVARSGIASARLLVAAPKLLLAYDQLRQPEISVADVAALVGYSSPRSLERQCQVLLGTRPAALRQTLPPDAFASALARGLLTARDPGGAAVDDPVGGPAPSGGQ